MLKRTSEAAQYLTVAESTLEAWRSRGGGPEFLKLGKAVRYSQEALDEFISARIRKNTGHIGWAER